MITKKGIEIIRHLMPQPPLTEAEFCEKEQCSGVVVINEPGVIEFRFGYGIRFMHPAFLDTVQVEA